MATFVAMYTKPEDADGFLAEYKADHVPIAERFPGVTRHSVQVYTATPRRTEPTWWLVYTAEWDSHEDMMAALQDPVMMEASKHAMGLLQKYGNTAEMMLGGPA